MRKTILALVIALSFEGSAFASKVGDSCNSGKGKYIKCHSAGLPTLCCKKNSVEFQGSDISASPNSVRKNLEIKND